MKRKERLRYYSLYTVIFAVLSFLVFFIFIKNGRSFVYESNGEDGIAQRINLDINCLPVKPKKKREKQKFW